MEARTALFAKEKRGFHGVNLLTSLLCLLLLLAGCATTDRDAPRPRAELKSAGRVLPPDQRRIAAPTLDGVLKLSEKNRWVSVIVRLKIDEGASPRSTAIASAQKRLQQGLSGTGFRIKRLFRYVPFATLEMDRKALDRLATLKVVAGVSEEGELYPMLAQSSPLVDASFGFKQSFPAQGVAVAILDSGIVPHAFFGDRIVEEFCFSSPGWETTSLCDGGVAEDSGPGSACASPDNCEHGVHVAGIAAGDNGSMSGIARGADIIALNASVRKTLFLSGITYDTYLLGDLVAALEKVLELTESRTIAAVNMSLGGGPLTDGLCDDRSENERAIKAVVDLLREEGVATIAASGNDDAANGMSWPACISSVISVGATDKSSAVADFSNSSPHLDFLAPGVEILSSVPGGGFEAFDGTSMATPHVTGAWAVLKSQSPTATVDEIRTTLARSGFPITDPRQERQTRMIKVEEALRLILPPEILLFPANGVYLAPHEVQLHVRERVGLARDLKTWIATNAAPEENGEGATLLCEGYACDFATFTLNDEGAVAVNAQTYFSLLDGTRVSSRSASRAYALREPSPGPTDVQASDGSFPDRIRVTWSPIPGADRYEVFASLSDRVPGEFAQPVNQSTLTEPTFDHFPEQGTGETLYYFVRARVDGFATLFGGPDTGHEAVASIPVVASDGTDAEGVRLTWDPTPWKATGLHVVYEIHRGTDADPLHASLLTTLEGTFINNFPAGVVIRAAPREYLDRETEANQTHFYWVKGIDGGDVSRLGEGESGFRAAP